MARLCDICGRGSLKSLSRSHSNIGTIRRQKVNLQSLIIDGEKKLACTSCIRSHTKKLLKKAVHTAGKKTQKKNA